jgi:hypothetical protein
MELVEGKKYLEYVQMNWDEGLFGDGLRLLKELID